MVSAVSVHSAASSGAHSAGHPLTHYSWTVGRLGKFPGVVPCALPHPAPCTSLCQSYSKVGQGLMVTASQTLFYCDTAGCDIACVPCISKLFSHGVNKHPLLPGLFLLRHRHPLVKLQLQAQGQVAVRGGGWCQLQ